MTTERRAVRATARFFEDLDRQLGAERGPDGQPSTNDFQVFDLFRIVETFATPPERRGVRRRTTRCRRSIRQSVRDDRGAPWERRFSLRGPRLLSWDNRTSAVPVTRGKFRPRHRRRAPRPCCTSPQPRRRTIAATGVSCGALDDLFVPLPALGTDANGPVYAAVCVTPDIERNQKRIS